MSKIVKVYCEGKQGSHDYYILDKVVSDLSVSIQAIGSKLGAGSAIQVYENLADKSDFYLFFRDRDFDAPVPATPSLTVSKGTKYIYYSYRTTIENYLFDAAHFYDFILEKKLEKKYQLNNVIDVQNLFTEAAKTIAYYQAIRHAMGEMRIPTDFGTTWLTKGSGTLPTPDELKDQGICKEKAWKKISEKIKKTDSWKEHEFDKQVELFYTKFKEESFYSNSEFLVWFQGKDFSASLSRLLPNFSMEDYYKFAKNCFDYKKFQDLVELRVLLESKFSKNDAPRT